MQSDHRSSSLASASQKSPLEFPDIATVPNVSSEGVEDGDHLPESIPLSNGAPKEVRTYSQRKDRNVYGNGSLMPGPYCYGNGSLVPAPGRRRQKSLSEAFRTIKDRRGSVSANVAEVADALKAPVSPKLVALCAFWYFCSIFSNASSKAILTAFRYPVTLTVIQFAFVSSWCIFSSYLAHHPFPALQKAIPALRYKIRPPSRELIVVTLPLTAFQIGGHILNSDAMSRIPVSLVHTIKGLSPLFTVLAYRFIFRVHYSIPTYLSLIPLTLGVVMASATSFSGEKLGLLYAFGSAILFVTQNIVSKKLFNEAARAESEGVATVLANKKPDKLNLLCYSSGLALLFTLPLWFWSEGLTLMHQFFHHGGVELAKRPDALDSRRLILEFIFNGIFHFAQSLVAFVLLSMISPVTYSVASLIKRVFVVAFSIVWFGNPMTRMQGGGIALTFIGLYLYDRTNDASRADRRLRVLQAKGEASLLPLVTTDLGKGGVFEAGRGVRLPAASPTPGLHSGMAFGPSLGYTSVAQKHRAKLSGELTRKDCDTSKKRSGSLQNGVDSLPPVAGWLPPGTRQEETWKAEDIPELPNGHGSGNGIAA